MKPSKWDTTDPEDFSYEVMGAWAALSAFPDETDIAVHRYRQLRAHGVRGDIAYYAFATWAAQRRDDRHPAAPYHAIGFTEAVARGWCARIGEILRDIEKYEPPIDFHRPRKLRSIKETVARMMDGISEGGRS